MVQVFELDVVEFNVGAYFFRQFLIIEQIHHPHGATGDFVFVSRADAAAGRADFFTPFDASRAWSKAMW